MMKIILTIAIPTYNRKEYLGRLLASLQDEIEEYRDEIEVLISDNASDDGTQEYIEKDYSDYTYLRNIKNMGADVNFLNCYNKAKGRYIWIIGSDDIVLPNSLHDIMSLLKSSDELNLIFLNHVFESKGRRFGPFIKKKTNKKYLVTKDKEIFASQTREQLSFVSALIINKDSYNGIYNPEKYIGTYFLHTCISLETTKAKDSRMAIVYSPCVVDMMDTSGTSFRKDLNLFFKVFFKQEHYVLCDVSANFGFEKKQMEKIYMDYICRTMPKSLLSQKAQGAIGWKDSFNEYVFPLLKNSLRAWMLIIVPMYAFPSGILKLLRTASRKIRRI